MAVVAVEPCGEMRAAFAALQELDGGTTAGLSEALDGHACSIPMPDDSVHAVVCAQSFHWFATPPALFEISRVLPRRGYLGLVWSDIDRSVPWLQRLGDSVLSPAQQHHAPELGFGEGGHDGEGGARWAKAFESFLGCYFGMMHHSDPFPTSMVDSRGGIAQRLALSTGLSAPLAPEGDAGGEAGGDARAGAQAGSGAEWSELVGRIGEALDAARADGSVVVQEGARGEEEWVVPHVTVAHWCQLIDKD